MAGPIVRSGDGSEDITSVGRSGLHDLSSRSCIGGLRSFAASSTSYAASRLVTQVPTAWFGDAATSASRCSYVLSSVPISSRRQCS